MEIKLVTLLNAQKTLVELHKQRGLSGVTAYRIMKNAKVIDEEFKSYDEQRVKLCEEFATKDENGKPIIKDDSNYDISNENMAKCLEELSKLREETVELPIKKVKLEDIDAAGFSPAEIENIEFMLDIGEE